MSGDPGLDCLRDSDATGDTSLDCVFSPSLFFKKTSSGLCCLLSPHSSCPQLFPSFYQPCLRVFLCQRTAFIDSSSTVAACPLASALATLLNARSQRSPPGLSFPVRGLPVCVFHDCGALPGPLLMLASRAVSPCITVLLPALSTVPLSSCPRPLPCQAPPSASFFPRSLFLPGSFSQSL